MTAAAAVIDARSRCQRGKTFRGTQQLARVNYVEGRGFCAGSSPNSASATQERSRHVLARILADLSLTSIRRRPASDRLSASSSNCGRVVLGGVRLVCPVGPIGDGQPVLEFSWLNRCPGEDSNSLVSVGFHSTL